MKNSLKKVMSEFTILDKEESKKFTINTSKNEKITIYDMEMVEKIIDSNFNQKYRKLLYIVMDISENEDSTESDTELALLKIEELKNILLSRYYKYISRELLNKYLKMIFLLDEKLRIPKRGRGR
ncbi:MAG: hypothetical protein E7161_03775 [Firmicutes bacterium]|nr:hypothetical protein [Bacillota bacterium]